MMNRVPVKSPSGKVADDVLREKFVQGVACISHTTGQGKGMQGLVNRL